MTASVPAAAASVAETFGRSDGALAVGGIPVERLAARVGQTPFFAYDRGAARRRASRRCARRCPPASSSATRSRPTRCRRSSSTSAGSSTPRRARPRASCRSRSTRPDAARRDQLRRPGQDAGRAAPGGRRRRHDQARVRERGRRASIAIGAAARAAAARRGARQPRLRAQGLGHADGRRAEAVRRRRRAGARAAEAACAPPTSTCSASTSSPARRTCDADVICEAQRKTVELALRLADAAPAPLRYLNLGGGFGIPYFDRDAPLDLAPIGANLEEPAGRRGRPRLPEARVVIELGRYLVGEAASTSPGSSTARSRAARRSSSSTAACTTSSPRRATSAR